MLTQTEENYIKALFKLTFEEGAASVGTNEIAGLLDVKPATVNNMLKKLREKELVDFKKYGKISMTESGKLRALKIIRKHRLWETFLVEKLEFSWGEVHDVAEQLEHIQSEKLVNQIDKLLGYPTKDPHGEPIPNREGDMIPRTNKTLLDMETGQAVRMVGVKNDSPEFLLYTEKVGLGMNQPLKVSGRQEFDDLIEIEVNGKKSTVSEKFADNIYVE